MAKTDFLTADMTRRQFMKISGKSLAGLTLSASMLSLFGCSQKQVDSGAVATWRCPRPAGGQRRPVYRLPALRDQLHADQRRRVLLLHQPREDPAPSESGRCRQRPAVRQRQLLCLLPGYLPPVRGPRLRQRLSPEGHYDQRAGHPCGGHRQVHRLRRLPRGLSLAYATVNPETGKSSKCIACGACVAGCPSGALSIVDWDAVTSAAQAAYMDL